MDVKLGMLSYAEPCQALYDIMPVQAMAECKLDIEKSKSSLSYISRDSAFGILRCYLANHWHAHRMLLVFPVSSLHLHSAV